MKTFLAHLQRHGENGYHPDEYAKRIGAAAFDALRALGILIEAPHNCLVPCGNCLDDCSRELFESETKPGVFVAECGREHDPDDVVDTCETVEIAAAELARVRVSVDALVRCVAEAHGLRDVDVHRVEGSPSFWSLGRGQDARAAIFCAAPYARGFEMLLLAQREPTLVLVPSRERVPGMISQRYARGERVEVRYLEDELVLEGGRISVVAAAADLTTRPATRRIVDRKGERELPDPQYEALVRESSALHLFLDLSTPTSARECTVHVLEADGTPRAATVSNAQARALLELARKAAPMRASELRTLSEAGVEDPQRLIERMRQKLDVKLGRTSWRFVKTVGSAVPSAKQYVFAPPPDVSFAFVVPA